MIWSPKFQHKINLTESVSEEQGDVLTPQYRPMPPTAEIKPSYALVTVKAYQLHETFAALSKIISPDTPIVLTQNGIQAPEVASNYFNHVLVSTPTFVAETINPKSVVQTLNGYIGLANYSDAFDPIIRTIVAEDLRRAGFHILIALKWEDILYPKLVLACTSAVFAVRDVSIQEALSTPSIRAEMRAVVIEGRDVVSAVLHQAGLQDQKAAHSVQRILDSLSHGKLPFSDPTRKPSRAAYTSLQQDLNRKRGATEVADLNGVMVQLGQRVQVNTPLNTSLLKVISYASKNLLATSDLGHRFRGITLDKIGDFTS